MTSLKMTNYLSNDCLSFVYLTWNWQSMNCRHCRQVCAIFSEAVQIFRLCTHINCPIFTDWPCIYIHLPNLDVINENSWPLCANWTYKNNMIVSFVVDLIFFSIYMICLSLIWSQIMIFFQPKKNACSNLFIFFHVW